jgi:flagellar assembly protein FliH
VTDPKELARNPPTAPTAPADSQTTPTEMAVEQENRSVVPAPPANSAPPKQEIDLSNYLELALAEKKIEQAYQKGLQAGKDKIEQDFQAATRALLSTCQQLDTIRETIISNSGEEIQQFVLAIAEKILRISVREQDSTIIATIEEALQRAVKSDEFTLYIRPEDYATVAENSTEIVAGLTGLNKIVIKKDKSVERGGAKIESDNCTIDATIVSQFEVIREEIQKNL